MVNYHDNYYLVKVELDRQKDILNISLKSETTKRTFIQRSKFDTQANKANIRKLLQLFSSKRLCNIRYATLNIEKLNTVLNHVTPVRLQSKTTRNDKTLIEKRHFTAPQYFEAYAYDVVKPYTLNKTSKPYNLAIFHWRGNDTCYFANYNTQTQARSCSCDVSEIINFVLDSPIPFIMDSTDYLILNQLIDAGGIKGIQSKSIVDMTAKNHMDIISVQDILGKRNKYDLVPKLAFSYIKSVIPYSESNNCLQHLEALKCVFDKHLQSALQTREHLGHLFRQYQASKYPTLAEKLFSKQTSQSSFIIKPMQSNEYTPLSFQLSTGKSGLGGVHGCIKKYVSSVDEQVVYFDYRSYYPSILLNHSNLFESFVDIEGYLNYFKLKQSEPNSDLREAYKMLINSFIGVLGTDKSNFKAVNRNAWEFIVRTGQSIMYDTLREISNLNPNFTLIHVNTDGAYYVKPRDEEVIQPKAICQNYALKLHQHIYEHIVIKDLNNYIINVDNQGEFIVKGDYKHCYCPFIKRQVYEHLFNYQLPAVNLDDFSTYMLYNSTTSRRYIETVWEGKSYSTHIDILPYEDIKTYNNNKEVPLIIDTEHYTARVNQLILKEGN